MSDRDELLAAAAAAAEDAYAPYSHFRVGAVVVAEDGTRYRGCNVENAAYGSTMCAEAVAIGTAVAAGARRLHTVAVDGVDAAAPSFPCGNCRQLMHEFGVERVIVRGRDGLPEEHAAADLLPHGFGPEALG